MRGETEAQAELRRLAARERDATAEVARLLAQADAAAREDRRTRWVPHAPTTAQARFLGRTETEVLYGGAAGGGKTDALLMAALAYADVPGYAALLLRRTYSDLALPGAIMDRAGEWLRPTAARWSDKDKRWTFPSGATLTFGYMDQEADRYRYQGAELQFVGVDELTQMPERWYTYLLSRLRRKVGVEVPVRARSATNPGGVGHQWVKRRFVDEGGAGTFVPAKLADNPHLDAETYREALERLDETTKRQLLGGEWVSDGGGLVYRGFDAGRNVVRVAPECDEYVLGIDYGFRDETAFSLCGWRKYDGCVYVVEVQKFERMIPSDAAAVAREYEGRGNVGRIVGDVGGLGKGYAEEARSRWGIPIEAAEKVNKKGYVSLLNGALERGELKVVAGTTDELVAEWRELPWNEAGTKEADGFANHASDATLYGWRACLAFLEGERPKGRTAEEREEEIELAVAGDGWGEGRSEWEAEPDEAW